MMKLVLGMQKKKNKDASIRVNGFHWRDTDSNKYIGRLRSYILPSMFLPVPPLAKPKT